MEPVSMESTSNNRRYIMIGGIILLVIVLIIGFVFYRRALAPTAPIPGPAEETVTATAPASTSESLGGKLYEKASNPLEDKLPSQTDTVSNPINEVYKNPFE